MLTYEEMGKLPADCSIIPNSCLSFGEAAAYVAEASTNYINEFFQEVGISELAIFEATGSVVVYEGSKLQSFKEGLFKVLDRIWETIKGLFKTVLDAFKSLAKNLDPSNKFNSISASHIDKIDDKKFEKIFGKFDFVLYNYQSTRDAIDRSFKNEEEKANSIIGGDPESSKEASNKFMSEVYSKISGCGGVNDMESMKKALRTKIESDSSSQKMTKQLLKSKLTWLKDEWSKSKKDLSKSYSKAKQDISNAKKQLNKLDDENMGSVAYSIRCLQTAIMANANSLMITYDFQRKSMKQAGTILGTVYGLTSKDIKKDKKEAKAAEKTNESASFIEEAFNW